MDYVPAISEEPIKIGRTDCQLAVLRSHPDCPSTLAYGVEGVWTSTNPAWPEMSIDALLERLKPPCHADWETTKAQVMEEKDGHKGMVVYVRPGPKQVTN